MVGLGDLGHIAGRGHITIPSHPVLSCLPLTAALSARPPSLLPAAVDMHLGLGPQWWLPTGPPLPVGHSASAPLSIPLGGRPSGLLSVTPPVIWALQRGVLWWQITLSIFQGPSLSGMLGPVPPVSLTGELPLSLVPLLPIPGKVPSRKSPAATPPTVRRRLSCQGWPAAQIPSTVGLTYAVRQQRTAGACRLPPLESSQTQPIPQPSRRASSSLPLRIRRSSQGRWGFFCSKFKK